MSLILDALKRAESERGAQAMSGLPALSPVSLAEPASPLRWVLMGGVAIVIAGLAGWKYFSAAPKTQPVETLVELRQESIEAAGPIEAAPARIAPKLSSEPEKPIIGTEEVASFDEVTGPEESQQLESPIVPAAPVAPEPEIRVAAPPPAPPPEIAQTPPRNKTPVKLNDTPAAYRAAFPALTFQVHSWDTNPKARFVRIDGYRYTEGETLASGPKIVEITANGLVLDWQGERVIYPLN
ncbi:MAG: general secretion pathway protein GspB [Pseudomonadota bacterium]